MYKQIIIARKDLNMSPGKLAAQVSHGSMAFLSWMIRNNSHTELEPEEDGRTLTVIWFIPMDSEIIDQIGRKYHLYVWREIMLMPTDIWLQEIFKLIEESKPENRKELLLKWAKIARELGYEIEFDD